MTNQLSCTLSVLFGHYWLCTSFVIDRSLGTYKGPATLHRRPPLGLVAWRRNSRTVSVVPHTSYASVYLSNHWGGPNTLLLSYLSYFPYFHPVFGPEFPPFVPKRRRQRGVFRFESWSESCFISPKNGLL